MSSSPRVGVDSGEGSGPALPDVLPTRGVHSLRGGVASCYSAEAPFSWPSPSTTNQTTQAT